MPNPLREDSRRLDTPVERVDDSEGPNDVLGDGTVEHILGATPEALRASAELRATVGICNAVIGGALIWVVATGAYLLLR